MRSALWLSVLGSWATADASCLGLNADFNIQTQESPPPAEATLGQSTQPVASTEDNDSSSATTTTATASSTSSSTTTQDPPPAGTSATTTAPSDSDTSSDTATQFPVDTNDGEWTPFSISLSATATTPRPTGYAMQLFFAHNVIVSQGADPQGKDLAIVYVEDGVGRSLNRWRDPQNPWNHTQTRLWFNLQRPLNPGEVQTGYYYLVRDSSVFNAKDDPNQIFFVYDNFQNGSFEAQDWQDVNEAAGNSNIVSTTDGISLQVSATGTGELRRSLLSTWNQRHFGVLVEARYRIPTSVNQSCNRMIPMAFETSSDNRVWHGMGMDNRRWRRTAYSSSLDQVQFNNITDSLPNEDGNWHRYAITWHDNKAGIWRDGELIDWVNSLNQGVNRPSQAPIRVRLAAQSRSGGCSGSPDSQIEFDWVWLRAYYDPEPKSSI